ncbi:MAG: phosphoribosylformylglycinamidine synthase subunit PurQ [Deltaproteobacteria bacterium]|nr:phosphoribosylformylglycinamidine synthase subunit PurQ [Deltaproteobacteria bacterium]
MKFSIVVFPGSNCDRDCHHVLTRVMGQEADYVFHKERALPATDCVILPGGFSYGDYLRSGAIARFSPIMDDVVRFAGDGGLVLGICNGFQVMLEAGLLPGAMRPNRNGRFICSDVRLKVENNRTPLTRATQEHGLLTMPIAHADGNYYAPADVLDDIEKHGQVLFRYVDAKGRPRDSANPNGSLNNIAGVMNRAGNCFGMMPHPERASEAGLGSEDGKVLFESLIQGRG